MRALLLVALLLAGCATPAADVDTVPLPLPVGALPAVVAHGPEGAGAAASDLLETLLLDVGHDAAEPTLGVNADGVLFITAMTFANDVAGAPAPLPRADILRSRDGGLNWEDVTPMLPGGVVRQQTFSTDPFLHLDVSTGRLFTIDQQRLTCYVTSYSDDEGESWQPPASACTHPVVDHQSLVTFKPRTLPTVGYPNGVLVCYNKVATSICVRSLDGGRTYHDAGVVGSRGATPAALCSGLTGHLAAAPDGTLYLPRAECGEPLLFRSVDDGLTWTRLLVSADHPAMGATGVSPEDPAVAVDQDGNVYVVWQDEDARVRLATSSDGGDTWSDALDITRPGLTAITIPTIAVGDAGKLVVAYYGSDVPDGYGADEETMSNATWHGYLAVVDDALTPTPRIVTARVSPADDPLVRGPCGPGRCPGIVDFMDVVIDGVGNVYAAFVDACVDACAKPDGTKNEGSAALVATLAKGPALRSG